MNFIRIGSKLLSRNKIMMALDKILELRVQGYSQLEVAKLCGIDRSFISRLETLGEVKRGNRVAVVGFPIQNKVELHQILTELGVEYILLLTEAERWRFFANKDGTEVFNELMRIVADLRGYDVVIFFGSDMRNSVIESVLGEKAITISIGESPITEDVYLNPESVRKLVEKVRVKQVSKERG